MSICCRTGGRSSARRSVVTMSGVKMWLQLCTLTALCFGVMSAAERQQPLQPSNGRQPNIVFIMSDDQDLHMDSLASMPLLRSHMIDKGLTFARHYCTVALCCPSRASLLTGKAAHNTNVTDINPPYGASDPSMKVSDRLSLVQRWVSQVRKPGFQRGIPASMAPRCRLQHVLRGQAYQCTNCHEL